MADSLSVEIMPMTSAGDTTGDFGNLGEMGTLQVTEAEAGCMRRMCKKSSRAAAAARSSWIAALLLFLHILRMQPASASVTCESLFQVSVSGCY